VPAGSKLIGKANELETYLLKNTPLPPNKRVRAKVILLIGQTGTGKSTFINSFANFLHGVQF